MILISHNSRGIGTASTQHSLKRLVFKHELDVLLLQETMCSELDAKKYLKKCFLGWSFLVESSAGNSGEPLQPTPTWSNRKLGLQAIDHHPIKLELSMGGKKPPTPFKFKAYWLTYEEYTAKSLSMAWAKSNFQQEDTSLMEMEDKIKMLHGIFLDAGFNEEVHKELDTLEKEKARLLAWNETKW
eukprot:Gb_30848 [translate_table: standard]